MAQQEDLIFDQGSDVIITFNLKNLDGSAKNLTDYSVDAKMKRTLTSDSDNTIQFNSIISNSEQGQVSLSLTNQITDQLIHNRYMYDVEISHQDSDANTIVQRVLQGYITISPSVTK